MILRRGVGLDCCEDRRHDLGRPAKHPAAFGRADGTGHLFGDAIYNVLGEPPYACSAEKYAALLGAMTSVGISHDDYSLAVLASTRCDLPRAMPHVGHRRSDGIDCDELWGPEVCCLRKDGEARPRSLRQAPWPAGDGRPRSRRGPGTSRLLPIRSARLPVLGAITSSRRSGLRVARQPPGAARGAKRERALAGCSGGASGPVSARLEDV